MKNQFFLFRLICISLLISTQYFAGQKTFTAASGTWSTAANWSPPGVPVAADTVTISNGSTCTANTSTTVAALIFNPGIASTISINNNRTLTITGSVQIKDSLTIGGSNNGSLTINGSLIVNTTGILIKSNGNLTVNGATLIYGTLVINNTGGTKTFTGLINISDTGVWNCTVNEVFTLGGGITSYGTFTSGPNTYTFNNNQSINGNPITFNGGVTISRGRNLTNNTTVTILGNLQGSNGTSIFTNSANAILNVAGGTVMSTGMLNASSNGNTVNYSRVGNQTVKATTFYNLTLSGSGTKTTTGVTVNGKLSRQGTATVSALPTYGASAVLEYKGSALQTTGIEFPAIMNNAVIIDNISGVNLNSAKTLGDSLILVNGLLTTTTTNLLTIGANGAAGSGNTVSFVNGPLAKIKNTMAQQTFLFPVGKDSCYRPLELIITHTNNTSSTYRAELFNTAPAGRTLPGTLGSVSTVRYWNITKTGLAAVSSAFVVLYYDTDDGVSDPENLRVAKDNGTAWVDLAGTANGSPDGSILSNSFTTFSDFVLANALGGSNPLPVELSSFKSALTDQEVLLTWITQTEVMNYGFEIERSSLDKNWEKIGFVEGHGNSNSPKEYSYSEKLPAPGKYFYRLKQIDSDGNFRYSSKLEIIVKQLPNSYLLAQNYPNPFNPETRIKFSVTENVQTAIKVYDLIGNEVGTLFNEKAEAGKIYEVIFNGKNYASGIYFYSISAGEFNAVRKMMLIK